MLERVCCRREWQDRARGQGCERAGGADRLVRFAGLCAWSGSGSRPDHCRNGCMRRCSSQGLPVELLETRHVRKAFEAMPVKTDRNDARGIAQLMRLGWFRPVHCKSLSAQEMRALLTARKLVQSKLLDVEISLRGILRGFGLKVGTTTAAAVRRTDRGTGRGPSAPAGDRQGAAGGACGAAERVRRLREADPQDGAIRHAGTAADVDAGGRRDRRADLCQRDRRSRTVQIVEAGWSAFRADAKEVSIRRDRLHRRDQQDRRRSVRTALYEAANVMLTQPVKGCSPLKSWAMRIAKRAGMHKAKVALARKLAVICIACSPTEHPSTPLLRQPNRDSHNGIRAGHHTRPSRSEVPSPGRWIRSRRCPTRWHSRPRIT